VYTKLLKAPIRQDAGDNLYVNFVNKERQKARLNQGMDKETVE
jgi:hypothetical protein